VRFLMVDAIVSLDGGLRAAGIKNAAMSEDYFADHFPQQPIVPGVLVLEAMVQLARWLVIVDSDFVTTLTLSGVQQCKFIDFAVPGDQMNVEVAKISGNDSKPGAGVDIEFHGTAVAHGRKTASATFACRTYPLDEFEDPEQVRRQYKMLRINGAKARG